jgi:hypothetical protein
MSASKRPSTSSLRRFITSRPYVPIAEIRRRFGLDVADAMSRVAYNGTNAYVGLPEREATKLQDLWQRGELGVELSVEVHAPVVVGVYPMRIARYVVEQANGNGHGTDAAQQPAANDGWAGNGHPRGGGHRNAIGQRNDRRHAHRRPQSRPEGHFAAE